MEGRKIKSKIKKNRPVLSRETRSTIGFILLIVALIILLYLYFNYYFFGGRVKSYINKGAPITVLFVGLDDSSDYPKTDTIMLGIYNPKSHRIGIISIPRDLRVEVPTKLGSTPEKINIVYTKYGLNKLIKVVEKLTSIDVNFHAIAKLSDIVKIVDILGGVEIYVDKPMKYIDKSGELYIDIPKGIIKLDGLKAMEFLRYRNDERGDMGRIDRQYEFILNLMRKAVIQKNILANIKMLKLLFEFVDTNMNFNDLINIVRSLSGMDFNNIDFVKIPGKFVEIMNVKYIQPDKKRINYMLKRFIQQLNSLKSDYLPSEIKVQVLNGSGKPGVAKRVRDKLVRNGYNVVEFGNADSQNYKETIILDRVGNMKKAVKVASLLKCNLIFPKINKFIMIDITVIVGKDYKKILR